MGDNDETDAETGYDDRRRIVDGSKGYTVGKVDMEPASVTRGSAASIVVSELSTGDIVVDPAVEDDGSIENSARGDVDCVPSSLAPLSVVVTPDLRGSSS